MDEVGGIPKHYSMKRLLILFGILSLTACEKEYSGGQNYVYTFAAKTYVDQWGIETWGGHNFIIDEKIQDVDKFKECYVNYLKWSGLDFDGQYNKIYYADPKNVSIKYMGTTPNRFTVKSIDNCQ